MPSIDRRRFVATAAAAGSLWPFAAQAQTGLLAFDVWRNGSTIGSHVISLRRQGERIESDIAIDLQVKIAFVTAYRYTHRNREVYEGNRLVAMDATTNDNGDRYETRVRAADGTLLVEGKEGALTVPPGLLPTTYWKPRMVEQEAWIDTQHGRVVRGESRRLGTENVRVGGESVAAARYAIRGDVNLDLWYGELGWTQLEFTINDSLIRYQRRPESDVASLPQAVRA